MSTTKRTTDYTDALARLREWITPGDTVYTILDHVSASGMSRHIRVVLLKGRCEQCGDPDCDHVTDLHPNYAVGKVLGLRHAKRNGQEQDALVVSGCGMDMGFHLVSSLSRALFPDGFTCTGKNCPSNDHVNGDRDRTPHHHVSGDYAIRHRWL